MFNELDDDPAMGWVETPTSAIDVRVCVWGGGVAGQGRPWGYLPTPNEWEG